MINKHFISFLNIIDSTSSISKFAFIEPDSSISIGINCVINSLAKINAGAIINTGAIIEHEVEIGKFSHIAPNATICGGVIIGENVLIGANSVIKQGVKIGCNVTVGAGAVVINDILDNTKVAGNPSKTI